MYLSKTQPCTVKNYLAIFGPCVSEAKHGLRLADLLEQLCAVFAWGVVCRVGALGVEVIAGDDDVPEEEGGRRYI